MTTPVEIQFSPADPEILATFEGRIALLTGPEAAGQLARRLSKLTRGALDRALASPAFAKLKPGEAMEMAFPAGLASALQLVRLEAKADVAAARKAGAAIGARLTEVPTLVLGTTAPRPAEVAFGLALRAYKFTERKSDRGKPFGGVSMMVAKPEAVAAAAGPMAAVAEGVFFTRDLVSEPANILTTTISRPVWRRCRNWAWRSRFWKSPIWSGWACARCWRWAWGPTARPRWW
jgi:leucyl aminopeptidase